MIFLALINSVNSYDFDPPSKTVHQHITNESKLVWKLIPYEIKKHLLNPINAVLDFPLVAGYEPGDDIITGSGEEDLVFDVRVTFNSNHLWQPDNLTIINGVAYYDDGYLSAQSSYRRALGIWSSKVIPLYLKGNINESYYHLGRVAHLLEDATSIPHVHLDGHPPWDDSVLEKYTGDNFTLFQNKYNWSGENFAGQQYNYEDLPNMQNFNWKEIEPQGVTDKQNIELFRFFWYTAQKTQYFASDDADGNSIYVNLSNISKPFTISLWQGDNVTIINNSADLADDDVGDTGADIEKETNAIIPHAMKAVAGLYRLFDDAVRIDWPTENHDYRRTGFTLLKGDLVTTNDVKKQINLVLDAPVSTEQVVKPSVADLDGNGFMDSVVMIHKTTFNTITKMASVETQKRINTKTKMPEYPTRQKWPIYTINGGAIYFPATLADIDSDNKKEIVTGVRNGTIYVYDFDNGVLTEKWKYHLEARNIPSVGSEDVRFNGGTAIADIDLDGDMEVIFADVVDTQATWPGKVYVLDGATKVNQTSYIVGNGGAYASISVANVDSDDYPEIIVPTQYGIKVLDYNHSINTLTEKCSNTNAFVESSPIIYDVDKDNDYELIYVTSDRACDTGKICLNRLYVIDAQTCANATNFPISFTEKPRPTATVANLDSDSQAEIIVSSVSSVITNLGTITAIDGVTGSTQWTYNDGGNLHPGFVSPNIADIDNDGNYNIILGENNKSTVYILKNDGNLLYKYDVTGFMDNGLAIADIDVDNMAEIVFKRAGSPTLFTSISNQNFPPEINTISNITAIAGNLININATGEVSAIDLEGNNMQFFYSSPFNSSGQWQTTINDTGNYSILVEASDGNLSTYKFVDVIVFNSTAKLTNSFNESSTQKILNFTQAGNLTVNVRLPKNATVIYSKIKIKGLA